MNDECYTSLSYETLALARKYAKSTGQKAVQEAVAQSKLYTDEKISQILSFEIEIVETLPQDPNTHTIYLVPKTMADPTNGYYEYIYVNNRWEVIGETTIDLSDYYTKEEVDALFEHWAYVLPTATTTRLGGVILDGSTIKGDGTGTISINEEGAADIINEVVKPIDNADISSLFN